MADNTHTIQIAPIVHPAPDVALPARVYMTSDLRALTGISRTHLDYYLREGLVAPSSRTESGLLLFDEEELGILRAIVAQRRDGVALRDIRLEIGR